MREPVWKANRQVARGLASILFAAAQIVGVAAFAYPFFHPQIASNEVAARASDAPLIFGASLVALFGLLAAERIDAKRIAMLGVLCAINSVLRLAETVVLPLPGGFSPMFLLIIVAGYAYGARFGFLIGSFSMLTSALVTGGVGPWLPFEMFGAGWVGLTAGLLGKCRMRNAEFRITNSEFNTQSPERKRSGIPHSRFDLILLLPFGFVWGFLYGAILNLYFWPLVDSGAGLSWQAGLGAGETLKRYAAFYVATSLWWDVASAIGNVALLAWLGVPILRALRRFGARFRFETAPILETSG